MSHDGVPFAEFYARYHRRLYGFAISAYGRSDADDIVQDAMLRAYRFYGRLDPGRDPWPWLVAIVRNVARDRYARPAPVPLAEVPAVARDGTADVEEREVVRAALGRLSSTDRTVLLLRDGHQLSCGELAGLLGRSPNAVRQQVFKARRRLAAAYTAIGGRALGLAGWLRWRAGGSVAAAVVAGALVTGGPAPAPPPARDVAGAPDVAGPAANGGTRAGPATGGAVPDRPLLRPRTTPARTPVASRPTREERRRAVAEPPRRRGTTVTGPGTAKAGAERATAPAGGDGVVCAVTALCPER